MARYCSVCPNRLKTNENLTIDFLRICSRCDKLNHNIADLKKICRFHQSNFEYYDTQLTDKEYDRVMTIYFKTSSKMLKQMIKQNHYKELKK